MSPELQAWSSALIHIALAFGAAFGLYKLIAPRGQARSAGALGRKWLALTLSLCAIIQLPRVFREMSADSFASWLILSPLFGGFAFLIGWFIGLFVFRRKDVPAASTPVPADPPPDSESFTEAELLFGGSRVFQQRQVLTSSPENVAGLATMQPTCDDNTGRRLNHLKTLLDKQLITQEDYDEKKREILTEI